MPAFLRTLQTIAALLAMATGALARPLDQDPYVADPVFWYGMYKLDARGQGPQNGAAWAQQVIRLVNGEVIAAGLTPASALFSTEPNNFGLSRYDALGQSVSGPWHTIDWPDHPGGLYSDVVALRRWGDRLFVLADVVGPSPEQRIVVLHAFDLASGGLLQTSIALQGAADLSGAGLAIIDHASVGRKLVVAGTMRQTGAGRIALRRYNLDAAGAFSVDGPVQLPAIGVCTGSQDCEVTAIASAGGSIGAPPRLYVAGTFLWGGAPSRDFFVARLDAGLQPDSGGFGALGMALVGFDEPGSGNEDILVALAVQNVGSAAVPDDRVYLVGNVSRACRPGIGVARLGHGGGLDGPFGSGGRLLFGGSGLDAGHPDCPLARTDTARAAVLSPADGRLAIVGSTTACAQPPCTVQTHGMSAIVDAGDGTLRDHRELPYLFQGVADRETVLAAVAGNGTGRVIAAGWVRFPTDFGQPGLAGKRRWALLGLARDRIFGNGLQAP